MCNLYSLTKGHLPAIFPDAPAPVVRTAEDGMRELAMMRWGLPSPAFALKGRPIRA